MIEKALARIKVGETLDDGSIPGLCTAEEYPSKAKANLRDLKDNREFYQGLIDNQNGDDITFKNIINKVNEYMNRKDVAFGFEEVKDFILLMGKNNVKDLRQIQFVNLIKESEINCDLQTIYMLNGKQYLVSNDHGIEIDNNIINNMIEDGYVGRNNQDRSYINGLNGITRK